MTKEYTEIRISKLFPSTLGVGDVVDWCGEELFVYEQIAENIINCRGSSLLNHEGTAKLKIKNITLSMVLEAMQNRKPKKYGNVGYIIHTSGQFGEYTRPSMYSSEVKPTRVTWKFRKDGKDLSLYDQSEELLRLVWEVLK